MFPGTYLVGSRSLDRYIAVPAAKLEFAREIAAALDGRNSVESLTDRFASRGRRVDVAGFVRRLQDAGLLRGSEQSNEISRSAVPLGEVPLAPVFVPFRRLIRAAYTPVAWISAFIAAAALYLIFSGVQPVRGTPSSPLGLLSHFLFPVCIIVSVIIHELAHAMTAMRFGALPTRLRLVSYLLVVPAALMTIRGLYALTPPRRLLVWGAGIWARFTLSAAAIVMSHIVPPGYVALLERVAAVNALIAGWNLLPLLPTDGYFIFSTLLKRPNIRSQAWRQLWFLGRAGVRKNAWLLLYAFSSLGITILVVFQNARALGAMAAESIRGFALVSAVSALLAAFAIARRRSARAAGAAWQRSSEA
jgi:putative peptide zinc metalloprotease protein